MGNDKSLFKSLYDFKMESFIAPRVLRFLYALFTILISAVPILFLLGSYAAGFSNIILLPIVILVAFLYLFVLRVWFEYLVVFFKIHENTEKIADKS